MDKSILELLLVATKLEVPMETLFDTTQDYSLQPQNSTKLRHNFIKVFSNSCAKNFGKLSEKRM